MFEGFVLAIIMSLVFSGFVICYKVGKQDGKQEIMENMIACSEETCVCCGRPIPEGRQICWQCEHELEE